VNARVLSRFKPMAYAASAVGYRALARAGLQGAGPPVGIAVERSDWAIRWWGTFVAAEANRLAPGTARVTTVPAELTAGIVEFGSQYQWVEWGRFLSPKCRFVTTFFHGKPEDGPAVARHIERFLASVGRLEKIVAPARLIRDRLLSWGVAADKIAVIPIGCETERFVPPSAAERAAARARFGILPHEIAIGSFQKDGEGWAEGDTPKLIKGPDILLAALAQLAEVRPIFVLLSGPARGYVRRGLDRLALRYAHDYVADRDALARLYHALDLYLVTSREEGGPMTMLESMASGVPVVATRVGMAPDLIIDDVTGALVEVGDVGAIVRRAQELIDLPDGGAALRSAARAALKSTDWSVVGRRHLEEVWHPLRAQR
jgi:glycosyltransferase involved in cell wall biosynthesis